MVNRAEYFTSGELAGLVGVSGATINNWRKTGKIEAAVRGKDGFYYYSKEQYIKILGFMGENIESVCENEKQKYMLYCWECGTVLPSNTTGSFVRLMCEECRVAYETEKQKTLQQYIELKIKVMYERALRIMERSEKVNMAEIQEASKTVCEYAQENPEAFASSHEMVAAIVLINSHIGIKMQYSVENKKVDIYVPSLNCGLEVDGYLHKGKEIKDSKRDILIRGKMGKGFEIIRIPTKYIERNPMMIIKYVQEAIKLKKQFRKNHNGILPDNFSRLEKELYRKVLKN